MAVVYRSGERPGVKGVAATAARPAALGRLLDAIAAVLDVDPAELTDESSPATMPSWDSLNHLNIAMAVESEFEIALTAEQVMAMDSVAAIRDALRGHGVEV